jgi:hypothetical protein
MKTLATILAGTALALAGASAVSAKTLAEKGEARLARMLEGRVAGEPVQCISAMQSNRMQVIEHVGVVYDAGNTIYVARPSDPRALGPHDALVINRYGGQLCRTDIRHTIDRYDGYVTGPVFLSDFVPYRRA